MHFKITGESKKKKEIFKYLKMNENENTTYQKCMDATKTMLVRKCIVLNVYIVKEEQSQINNLSFHLKKLEKRNRLNPKQMEKGNNKKL